MATTQPYRKYLENQKILGEGRLPSRTLLLPAQKRGVTYKNFTDSNRVQLLSGDCRRVTVAGEQGAFTAEGAFSFSFHNFTLESLTQARHCDELEESARNYLYIDHRQRGLGSHSCGPEPEKAYELPIGRFRWMLRLRAEE